MVAPQESRLLRPLLVLHGTSSAYTVTAVGPRDGVNTIGPFVPSAR